MEKNLKINGEIEKADFHVEELKEVSDQNIEDAKNFLKHSVKWFEKEKKSQSQSNISSEELRKIILEPSKETKLEKPFNLEEIVGEQEPSNLDIDRKTNKIKDLIKKLEDKKNREIEKNIFLTQQQEKILYDRYKNIHFLDSIESEVFESKLRNLEIRKILLITDTIYTRGSKIHRSIIDIIKKCELDFVEYTNVQPNIDRRLVFKIAEFAHDHEINTIIILGSSSTADLIRTILPKIIKPNIISLHQNNFFKNNPVVSKYYIFNIPTFVVPDPTVNARSVIKNNVLFPNIDFLGDTIFLKNLKDESDSTFYCKEIFDLLNREKTMEVLHETFFRLIINYFDLSAGEDLTGLIIENLRNIQKNLDLMKNGQEMSDYEKHELMKIIASTVDGRAIVDAEDFWIWYNLEGSLSLLTNSKKSYGLALFLPTYLEVMSKHSVEFSKRALQLGKELYNCHSIEGLKLKIIMHIKNHDLPISFLDISGIKKLDYMFLIKLIKKARTGILFTRLTKIIIKNLTIW